MRNWNGFHERLLIALLCAFFSAACRRDSVYQPPLEEDNAMTLKRHAMVELLRSGYGIQESRVLEAMLKIRRHLYIPEEHRSEADPYGDHPCAIGSNQTISQPYIVAYMTQLMNLLPGEKVLEIGTGSGYQAAVLAEMGVEVYSIELLPELADHAQRVLTAEGYRHIQLRTGDGYRGWPEKAPFNAIIVTCAPSELPAALVEQLQEDGRMILPLGGAFDQRLVILRKINGAIQQESDLPVRFVPMVHGGAAGTE